MNQRSLCLSLSLWTMIFKALIHYFFHQGSSGKADTCPARGVDLSRYLGRWYELARYGAPFETGLEDVYTEYKMRADGKLLITNYGTDEEGCHREAHAIGTPVADGRLKVSFIPLLRFLSTPYNILSVDKEYNHALVSNGSGSSLWILSRRPVIIPDAFDKMRDEAQRRGFETGELHYTRHSRR